MAGKSMSCLPFASSFAASNDSESRCSRDQGLRRAYSAAIAGDIVRRFTTLVDACGSENSFLARETESISSSASLTSDLCLARMSPTPGASFFTLVRPIGAS